jgi:hypothetical protein
MVEDSAALLGIAIAGIGKITKRLLNSSKKYPKLTRTMHLAPQDVLVTIEVNLIDGLDTDRIETVIENIEQKVKQAIPYVNPAKVFVELEREKVSDLYKRKRWK